MQKIVIFLVIFAFVLITGCATTRLEEDEAKEYFSLDVEQFVKERFIQKEGLLSKLNKGVSHLSSMLDGARDEVAQRRADSHRAQEEFEKRTTGLQKDGKSVIYNAYYTSMNVDQLFRPKQELSVYCKAQGGKLIPKKIYRNNFVRAAFVDPRDAFVDAMNTTYTGVIAIGIGPIAIAHSMNDYKDWIAQDAAMKVARYNASVDRKGAENGFMSAANANSYGRFSCESANADALWTASIIPFYFRSQSPNDGLSTHKLKILIVPEKTGKSDTHNNEISTLSDLHN